MPFSEPGYDLRHFKPLGQSSGYSFNNDNDDFPAKPPSGQGGFAALRQSLWLVPVLRYLITVNPESVYMDAAPVASWVPVLLQTAASWWFHEAQIINLLNERNERVLGDPVLFYEEPVDMDNGSSENTQNDGHDSSGKAASGKTGSSGINQSNNGGPSQTSNQGRDEDDEDDHNQESGITSVEGQNKSKTLVQLLIDKIQVEDELSVFCLLHYTKVNPNQIENGQAPLLAAHKTKNQKIVKLLYDYGAVEPHYGNLCSLAWGFKVDDDRAFKVALHFIAGVDILNDDLERIEEFDEGWYGDVTILSMLTSQVWDKYHWVRVLAFKQLSSEYNIDVFLIDHSGKVILGLSKDNAFEYSYIELGHLSDFSAVCLNYLLHIVKRPFILENMGFLWSIKSRGQSNAQMVECKLKEIIDMGLNEEISVEARGELLSIIYSRYFRLIFSQSPEYINSCCCDALDRLSSANLNTLSIEGVPFFQFILNKSCDYAWHEVKLLIYKGLIPWVFNKKKVIINEESDFVLLQLKKMYNHLELEGSLQASCARVIFQCLSNCPDISSLPLPPRFISNIFIKAISNIERHYSSDEKRNILKKHFRNFASKHLSYDFITCPGHGSIVLLCDDLDECSSKYSAQQLEELWDERIDSYSEDVLDKCYPDDVIEEFEYNLDHVPSFCFAVGVGR